MQSRPEHNTPAQAFSVQTFCSQTKPAPHVVVPHCAG
jgi:hypothetical protein